jgi:hypothetical protein
MLPKPQLALIEQTIWAAGCKNTKLSFGNFIQILITLAE